MVCKRHRGREENKVEARSSFTRMLAHKEGKINTVNTTIYQSPNKKEFRQGSSRNAEMNRFSYRGCIFDCFCNVLPKTEEFKTRQFCGLTVREVRSQAWIHCANLVVSAGLRSFLEALGVNAAPGRVQRLENACTLELRFSSSTFKASIFYLSGHSTFIASPSRGQPPLAGLLLSKTLVIILDPPGKSRLISLVSGQLVNDLHSNCYLHSPYLSFNLTVSQVPGMRAWISMGMWAQSWYYPVYHGRGEICMRSTFYTPDHYFSKILFI